MFRIISNSFKLTLQELKVNKMRTALSLTGIAFGIFCIIGVLATVNSLEKNIQDEVKSLGSNTVYIDKWDYSGNSTIPRWKMIQRPYVQFPEAGLIKERTDVLENIIYLMQSSSSLSARDETLNGVSVYGIVEEQNAVQPLKFAAGRYFSNSEFNNGSAVCLIGFDNAENLFRTVNNALGKQVDIKGKKLTVVGVIAKEGTNFVGWDYDNCIMMPYRMMRQMFSDRPNTIDANPILIAKAKTNIEEKLFISELRGAMRQVRRLGPTEDDNFSLNSVSGFSKAISEFFGVLNLVGAIIGGISLIVGMFGIANIMFVTVKERTPVIGLKKAIGAKKSTILFEFLSEAAMLCIMGGMVGLLLVIILAKVLSGPLDFPLFVSWPLVLITFLICLVVGVVAGIIPASQAAKMDPVAAIRAS